MQEFSRLVWDPSKWLPMPPVYHLFHVPNKKAVLAEAEEGGEGLFCILVPFRYGKAMPTDGAVQSRDRRLWQSTGEAAAQHGIRIIEHNDR